MRQGRRHDGVPAVGNEIDFWRVVAVEPGHRLTLLAEMKLPGTAMVEYEVRALDEQRSLRVVTAYSHPAGAPGLACWRALAGLPARTGADACADVSGHGRMPWQPALRFQRMRERRPHHIRVRVQLRVHFRVQIRVRSRPGRSPLKPAGGNGRLQSSRSACSRARSEAAFSRPMWASTS